MGDVIAALLVAGGYIPAKPIPIILTVAAVALILLVGYRMFKEPNTKVNETLTPEKGTQENLEFTRGL